jgi:hypothetical protein
MHTGTLCQQSDGTVKTEQKPAMIGGRAPHRALSPKRPPFQTGTFKQSKVAKVARKRRISPHILCDCEAIAYLRFQHMGYYIMEPRDYHDAPIKRLLRLTEV